MISYQDLTPYERELINTCVITSIDPEVSYIAFQNKMQNYYYKSHRPNEGIEVYNAIKDRISSFLVDNDFAHAGFQFNKKPNAEALRRATTIELYFGAIKIANNKEDYITQLELLLKQQQARLNDIDLKIKPQNHILAIVSLILAVIALLTSVGLWQWLLKYIQTK